MEQSDPKATDATGADGWAGTVEGGHVHASPDGAGGLVLHALSGNRAFLGNVAGGVASTGASDAHNPTRPRRVAAMRAPGTGAQGLRALSDPHGTVSLTPTAGGGALLQATHAWGAELLPPSARTPAAVVRTLEARLSPADGRAALQALFTRAQRGRLRRLRARAAADSARVARDEAAAALAALPDARAASARRAERLAGALNAFKRGLAEGRVAKRKRGGPARA